MNHASGKILWVGRASDIGCYIQLTGQLTFLHTVTSVMSLIMSERWYALTDVVVGSSWGMLA